MRTADPYRDTDVIDSRAPRANQAVVAVVALLGVIFGWPLAWALMGAQLAIGLLFGRQYCLPCVFYFEVLQRRFGEGELEDARPPRLANQIGCVLLISAAAAWWLGSPEAGTAIAALVAALATLASSAGICAGCELYRAIARLRGIRPGRQERIEPSDLPGFRAGPRSFVQFTHPLCSECHAWERRLATESLVQVDVSKRPEIARRYGIAVVPTVLAVGPRGEVLERLAP